MAKQVQPLEIILGIKGAEKLAALKSSFRDLTKTVKQSDEGIDAARKSINDYVKSANSSEAVIKGQIKAFEGLREQAAMGGKVYRELSNDIADLKAQLNGSTSAIDAQRKSLLETAGSARATKSQLLSVANALSTLQKQTALGSKAFVELGADIASLEGKIAKVKTEQEELNKLNFAANQAASGGAAATRLQIRAINEKVASLREEKQAIEELSRQRKIRLGMQGLLDRSEDVPFRNREYIEQAIASSLLGQNITKMFGAKELQTAIDLVKQSVAELQSQVEVELGSSARRAFQEMAREGRESARSLAIAFSGPEFERIFANLEQNVGGLPDTTAGLSQRLRELERVLNNTERSSVQYRRVSEEISRVQKELAKDVYSYSEALEQLAIQEESAARRRSKLAGIEEYVAAVSGLGPVAAAERAARGGTPVAGQMRREGFPQGYRDPESGAMIAPGYGSRGDRRAYQEAEELKKIAEAQKELEAAFGSAADSYNDALRVIQQYQEQRHNEFMSQIAEENAAQQKAFAEQVAREDEAFRQELSRRNILLQAQKAAASALGLGGREDISSLYQGIIGLSTADIRRQQEMMGKSAKEVFNDIATAFGKGGRAVDLKAKSTDIGDSIAEGVVDGATKSSEINKGAKTFAQRLIAAYKAVFGIKSPSKETEQKIGIPLGRGIIRGLLSALRSGKKEVRQEIESIAEPLIRKPRQPRRLIGTVNENIATFTGYGTRPRPAMPGYRPLQSNIRLDSEIERMFNQFRVNIAAVTTDAEIYYNLLQSLPSSKITTDIAGLASRRANAAEVPGFMEAQRIIGPGDLEQEIARSVAEHLKSIRTPDPWIGVTGDYQKFIDSIVSKTQEVIRLREYLERFTVSGQGLLPGKQIAGALPAARIGYTADPDRLSRLFGLGEARALPPARSPEKKPLALPSAEMREFYRDVELELRKLKAKVRGGSEGEHFMEPGRGGGRYQGGFFGGGVGGGRRRGAAGAAGDEFSKLNQVLKDFGPLSDRSVNDIRELGASLNSLGDIISPLDADFKQVNDAIAKQSHLIDRELQKRERRKGRRRMSPMQMTQAAGAVISGGIFGGPEGLLGGAIGAFGGVGGAFAGAAIGAQVGAIRKTLGGYADYAAQIERLKIALGGIAGPQEEYNRALNAANSVTKSLNVPQEVAIQGITRLTAAVKGAGGGVADAELAFKNINSAIIATGGGAEQVEGAVTALVQIFSKGKVSAEEINQIAERLPGTFNKIAAASGRTGPELTKALQDGKVGLNDLMKFLVSLGDEYGELAEKIAGSSENAGARLQIAFNNMRIEVGKALQPIGAEFQDTFTRFIEDITPALVASTPVIARGFKSLLDSVVKTGKAIAEVANFLFKIFSGVFKEIQRQGEESSKRIKKVFSSIGNFFSKVGKFVSEQWQLRFGEVVLNSIKGGDKIKKVMQSFGEFWKQTVDFMGKYWGNFVEYAVNAFAGVLTGPVQIILQKAGINLGKIVAASVSGFGGGPSAPTPTTDDTPDLPINLTDFPGPDDDESGGSKKAARDAKRKADEIASLRRAYDALFANRGILTIQMQQIDAARDLKDAQDAYNQKLVDEITVRQSGLQFEKEIIEARNEYEARSLEIKETLEGEAALTAELIAKEQLLQKLAVALGEQFGRIKDINADITRETKEQNEAIQQQLIDRQRQLGLISQDEYNQSLMGREERRIRRQFPRASEEDRAQMLDLYRQEIDPTPFEKMRQNIAQLKEELNTLIEPVNQITNAANAIGDAFAQSFVDAISGATTAKQALADFFQSVGSYFLDMAKQMIAKMIQIAILNSIVKLLPGGGGAGGGGGGSGAFDLGGMGQAFAPGGSMPFPMRANGGPVSPGSTYLVGERGPELLTMGPSGGYVTSNSASQAAMDRYSSGNARGGSISVNYNVTDINGMRFVTEDQFRAGVAQAAKQGADGGFNRTMSSLKNNRSTRSRIGV